MSATAASTPSPPAASRDPATGSASRATAVASSPASAAGVRQDGSDPSANRGPAAAAGNRRALLAAARRLFAERGYHVPLSAVAREAGVGQGSLYRHFPTRLDLALAIFEENFAELEQLAAAGSDGGAAGDAEPGGFLSLWRHLLELLLASTAFIELVVDRRHEVDGARFGQRLRGLLAGPLARAQAAGEVDAELTVDELALVLRMVYGVVVTETDPSAARSAARRTLRRVDPTLALTHEEAGR